MAAAGYRRWRLPFGDGEDDEHTVITERPDVVTVTITDAEGNVRAVRSAEFLVRRREHREHHRERHG